MSVQKERLARKAQLMKNLREANPRLNVEDLIALMQIVAEETIEEYDQNGFFDCDMMEVAE